MLRSWFLSSFSMLTLAAGACGISAAVADDPPSPDRKSQKAAATKETSEDQKTPEDEAKPEVKPIVVPEDEKELEGFLEELRRTQPTARDREGLLEHFARIGEAVDEVLKRKTSEEVAVTAAEMKLAVYNVLGRLGDEQAPEKMQAFIEKIADDPRPGIKELASRIALITRLRNAAALSPEEQRQLVTDIAAFLKDGPITITKAAIARQTVNILEQTGDTELAASACETLADILATSEDKEIQQLVETMRGVGRRLALPGRPIRISGTTMAGEKYDISQHKGKVVLVDFWATWCGPCVAELPNVQKQYARYHDKGFEVVGISVDDDREGLEEFLEEREIPWTTLHALDAEGESVPNPNAEYYGITGIPTAILVDQDGKVVSMRARGRELPRLLEELLGPTEEPADEDADAKKKPSSESTDAKPE